MNGCELPVVINSGSGNQGLTASLPVIEYAKETGADRERLYRALVISNLTSVHLKEGDRQTFRLLRRGDGRGGSGSGIAWLLGGGLDEINHTIVNTLANVSGIYLRRGEGVLRRQDRHLRGGGHPWLLHV